MNLMYCKGSSGAFTGGSWEISDNARSWPILKYWVALTGMAVCSPPEYARSNRLSKQ